MVDGLPVQYRYEGNIFSGEKRTELLVVPALSVRVSPEVAIVPGASAGRVRAAPAAVARPARRRSRRAAPRAAPVGRSREIRVTVVNDTQRARRTASVKLELPAGWTRHAGRSSR